MMTTPATERTNVVASLRRLKESIQTAVAQAVDVFEQETGGLTPTSIRIDLSDVTNCGDIIPRRVVGNVEIDLGSF